MWLISRFKILIFADHTLFIIRRIIKNLNLTFLFTIYGTLWNHRHAKCLMLFSTVLLCRSHLLNAADDSLPTANYARPHIEIISYGIPAPVILLALPQMRPGYDMGVEMLRSTYQLNISLTYLFTVEIKSCGDLPDHLDLVTEYYYRKRANGSAVVLILPR